MTRTELIVKLRKELLGIKTRYIKACTDEQLSTSRDFYQEEIIQLTADLNQAEVTPIDKLLSIYRYWCEND